MRVKIVDIQNKNGVTRTDGRYPLRIGCIASDFWEQPFIIDDVPVGEDDCSICLMIQYEQDNQGNPRFGILRTSPITVRGYIDDCFRYETLNSIYILQPIDVDDKEEKQQKAQS